MNDDEEWRSDLVLFVRPPLEWDNMSLAGRHHQFRHRDWYISNVSISKLLLILIFFKIRAQSAIQINNLICSTHRCQDPWKHQTCQSFDPETKKWWFYSKSESNHHAWKGILSWLLITVQTFKPQHKPKTPWNFVKVTVRLTWSQTSKRSSELWTVISLKYEVVNILITRFIETYF